MKNLPILFAFALCAISGFGQAGALDTAFGIGGKIIPAPSFTGYDKEMALQIDGKIVVAVSDNKGYFTVFRYLPMQLPCNPMGK